MADLKLGAYLILLNIKCFELCEDSDNKKHYVTIKNFMIFIEYIQQINPYIITGGMYLYSCFVIFLLHRILYQSYYYICLQSLCVPTLKNHVADIFKKHTTLHSIISFTLQKNIYNK